MRELVGSKNTIGQMASVLKKLQKATFTFTFYLGQQPEPSQATGMALVRCILGKFLGIVCHCFPPRLDVPIFAARCLHVRKDARYPNSERWNYGNFAYMASLFTPLGIIYMPKIYNM